MKIAIQINARDVKRKLNAYPELKQLKDKYFLI